MSVQLQPPPSPATANLDAGLTPGEPRHAAVRAGVLAGALLTRGFEIAAALLMLVAMLPIMGIVALAIRLESPGPVLFRQRRVGRGMNAFTVLKFRSMSATADSTRHQRYIQELIAHGEQGQPEEHGLYKLAVDDRITRVGRLLRTTSLDELPQLWNVVRGEMSLVGPRPVIEYEVESYPDWYFDRFAVRPGLTGLWQVNGRNQRSYEEMVRFDVEYARTRSFRLDVAILLKTIWVVISGRGVA